MARPHGVLLQEAFSFHCAIALKCGQVADECAAGLSDAHVDALLYFASEIQTIVERRGRVRTGSIQ
jgi:hypothetical protein